jgi:hypothetical protein
MATALTAYPTRYKAPTEVLNVEVSFAGKLKANEVLNGSPSVAVSPSGPTLGSASVSTKPLLINKENVEVGKAILFTISGGNAGDYVITVTAPTSGSQTLVLFCNVTISAS